MGEGPGDKGFSPSPRPPKGWAAAVPRLAPDCARKSSAPPACKAGSMKCPSEGLSQDWLQTSLPGAGLLLFTRPPAGPSTVKSPAKKALQRVCLLMFSGFISFIQFHFIVYSYETLFQERVFFFLFHSAFLTPAMLCIFNCVPFWDRDPSAVNFCIVLVNRFVNVSVEKWCINTVALPPSFLGKGNTG